MLAKGRDGATAVSPPDTTGPTCPGPSSQCREQQWLLGRGREGELGKPGTLGVRGVGSQDHVLAEDRRVCKLRLQATSTCFIVPLDSLTEYKFKDKIIKNLKRIKPQR